mmetsp:Transcript_2546/g.5936  ORF Transcript_2546/g.5936 Transcript_2546/m.5936 type:complete len:541 (+) Transcript_2546:84-1706(+)
MGGSMGSTTATVRDHVEWCWERRYRVDEILAEVWSNVRPGGRLHPDWFFEAKGHIAVELLLFATIIFLLTRKSFKPKKEKPLTKKEQDELIEEWTPEPLVPRLDAASGMFESAAKRTKRQYRYKESPVVKGRASAPHVWVQDPNSGRTREMMNLVSTNFLNLATSERIEDACERALTKYGCGSCGPRGFYGTIDVHLELEKRIARFLGTEEAILYSYDISTPASAIPAFCKSGDLIVADRGCSYAIQSGMTLSRSLVKWFDHNDMSSLEAVLEEVEAEEVKRLGGKQRKKGTPMQMRRFVVVEGLYQNYGDVCPLREIVALKEKYHFRLIVDESIALGTLGEKGRGSAEHHGLEAEAVDITLASLGHAIGSVGGICAGSRRVCDHQRLSGAGYVFSASLPPYLASAALESLNILEEASGPELVAKLKKKAALFRGLLAKAVAPVAALEVHGGEADAESPLVHLQVVETEGKSDVVETVRQLEKLCEAAMKEGLFISLSKFTFLDRFAGRQSIKLAVNASHTDDDLRKAVATLKKVILKTF